MTIRVTLAAVLVMSGPLASSAAVLETPTLDAWNDYIRQAHSQMMARAQAHRPFLWADETPDRTSQVRSGQILVAPVGSKPPNHVSGGLIHHWIGAVFLPNVTLDDTLATVSDYGRYKEFYQPSVADSKSLGRDGAEYRFSMVLVNKTLFSRTALDSECGNAYFQVDARRWYSVGYSSSIREIENYGQATEWELPPDEGSGYLWRLYSFARFEERDGGVYVESEVIALSRDIPVTLRWLVEPIVNRVARSSLSTSLLQTRKAVLAKAEASRRCCASRLLPHHLPAAFASGRE